ncbi:MAG: DUF177 domain-containing protein [Candidatus Margulisbacteria bacterium]|nr:DUF177 domain-containing protein [Candidatus Margulisiibacteriota bacterium]MBU1021884.1 DUF177 domain-containing protein [Candidatus Margulisiibacteriota bacterium]MBU1728522.1 DUF177 domain-containing protein [Candidatus Margulisiibacteriota bacterium]MBU1954669.1 DUF177 domain-containing protein [Candidatus Margulisiibacteriota bacterium]
MKIDISHILKAAGEKESVKFDDVIHYEDENVKISSPVKLNASLVNTGKTILLTGTAELSVELTCCRCLKKFNFPVKLDLDEEYSIATRHPHAKKSAEEVELRDEDFVFEIGGDNTIDLFEAIRQNLLSAVPIKPLCKETCQGFVEKEKKAETQVDPRLEKLKKFKHREEK